MVSYKLFAVITVGTLQRKYIAILSQFNIYLLGGLLVS